MKRYEKRFQNSYSKTKREKTPKTKNCIDYDTKITIIRMAEERIKYKYIKKATGVEESTCSSIYSR